jgi:hypothetical protein
MTAVTLWLARAASIVGLAIPVFWLVVLWDFLHHRGPSPGAGAQYVFILMPTMALAMILLGVSAAAHVQALARDPSARRPVNWMITGISGLGFLVMTAYWLLVAFRAAAA